MTSCFSTMSFAERYGVFTAHDPRFDGQFFSMVRSTGIYCRPSCSVRVPKPENMSFVATSAAAHEAGYRACKLCLPEMVPGSPEWDSRNDTVGRAMRSIREGWIEREGAAGLAAHLGCSERQLDELLTDELGAGPRALARAQRARTAQMLLQRTDLSMADVAACAGFTSTRQFGDTIRKVFALTPSELRDRRKGEVSPEETIDVVLPHREPIDLEGVFAWLAARSISGVEIGEPDSYTRLLALPGGHAWMRAYRSGEQLRLQMRLQDLGDLPALIAAVRRLFDLDADPVATDDALAAIPGLAALVETTAGIRVPGTLNPDEMLIRAMIGQQVTVSAARTALTRLAEALGRRVEGHDGVGLLFPTMEAIAEHGHEVLRGPAARIRAIVGAASALASGEIVLRPSDDSCAQREALLSLPGVGPWTADYVRMRVTGDPDVFLSGDVAVRNGAALAGLPSSARELDDWSTRAAPRRSYLCAHLWRAPKVLG